MPKGTLEKKIIEDKRIFKRNEKITLVLYSNESIGKRVDIKLFTPTGESIESFSSLIKYKRNISRSSTLSAQELFEKYGIGSYKGAFYIDGNYETGIDFVIE